MIDKDLINYFVILALSHWAIYLVSTMIKNIVTGITWLQDRFNETEIGKRLEIDDRFTKRLTDAVEGLMPLAEDLKNDTADGKLTPGEIEELRNKAWRHFKDALNLKDWQDFGKLLVPGHTEKMDKSIVEDALKKKFDSLHVKAVNDVKRETETPVRGALPTEIAPPVVGPAAGGGPGNS